MCVCVCVCVRPVVFCLLILFCACCVYTIDSVKLEIDSAIFCALI